MEVALSMQPREDLIEQSSCMIKDLVTELHTNQRLKSHSNHMPSHCRTSELQDKIQTVQDDLQRVNTSIDEHEGERSTKYRELKKKEQAFKGSISKLNYLFSKT